MGQIFKSGGPRDAADGPVDSRVEMTMTAPCAHCRAVIRYRGAVPATAPRCPNCENMPICEACDEARSSGIACHGPFTHLFHTHP